MHPELNSRSKLLETSIVLILLTSCASAPSPVPYLADVESRDIVATAPVIEHTKTSEENTTTIQEGLDTPILQAEDLNSERARYFDRQAQNQSDKTAQVDSALSSAEYYIQARDFNAAERAATRLFDGSLSVIQLDRLTVINAYIAHARGEYIEAISMLEPLWNRKPEQIEIPQTLEPIALVEEVAVGEPVELPTIIIPEPPKLSIQQVDALLLGSFSYQALGDFESAISLLIRRERALAGSSRNETTRYIWQVISSLPLDQRRTIFESTQNSLVRNRIEPSLEARLAPVAQAPQQFTQWQENQQSQVKQSLEDPWNINSPRDIAVLLPKSSKFNKAAQAVQDGINYQHDANQSPYRPTIRFIDIGDDPYSATQHYFAALHSGADFIIGPLGKDYANQIGRYTGDRTSTLLLGGDTPLDSYTSRFTMSPEMEGARVAERAWRDGHLSAALLVTETVTSGRTVAAFKRTWQNLGGKINKTVMYSPEQYDHSVELKQLFDINQSQERHSQLSNVLGFKPKFSAYQRSDIDFIFMIASTETGRLIRPQVNFFSGSRVPVYSTSAIFNGIQDEVNNYDLDGTLFAVMPWVLRSAEVAPYAGQLNMLFALGSDAYSIAASYQQLRGNSDLAINGNTGQVSIGNYGEATFQPVWATFNQGQVVPIETFGLDISPLSKPNNEAFENKNVNGIYNDSTYNSQTWDQQSRARKKQQEDIKDGLRRSR